MLVIMPLAEKARIETEEKAVGNARIEAGKASKLQAGQARKRQRR